MPWTDAIEFSQVPAIDRRRARTLAKSFSDADTAAREWPLDDRWLLPLLGLPHGLDRLKAELELTIRQGAPKRAKAKGLNAYLAQLGVQDLLDVESHTLSKLVGYRVHMYGKVYQMLAHGGWYCDEVLEVLEQVARLRVQFRLAEVEQRPQWAAGSRSPALAEASRLVYGAYRKLRKTTLPARDERLELDWDCLELRSAGGTTFELDPPSLGSYGPAGLVAILRFLRSEESDSLGEHLSSPRWQRQLLRLDPLLTMAPPQADEDKPLLGWVLLGGRYEITLLPVRCRPKKRGEGYVTRRIQLSQVSANLWTEPADEDVLRMLRNMAPIETLLTHLCGHPRLFATGFQGHPKGSTVIVKRVEVALGMLDEADGIAVTMLLDGRRTDPERTLLHQDLVLELVDGVLRFAPIRSAERAVLNRLPAAGLVVPKEHVGELLERLPTWAESVRLAADPGVLGPSVDPDLRPIVRLEMDGPSLSVQVRVQPLPEVVSTLPGQGSPTLAAVRDGEPVHIQRDLAGEVAAVQQALEPLDLPDLPTSPFRWMLNEVQHVLHVVEGCRNAEDRLRVRWAGRPPGLADRRLDATDLSLRVSRSTDWFGVRGTARVGGEDLPLTSLLEAVAEGHAYVPLSKGQWVGLSDGLRDHLATLARIGADKDGLRLSGLHAPLLDGLLEDGAELDAPADWFAMGERLYEAAELTPKVPDALQATLRPYQREGFVWLARMAHWAPGAMLADDMGLGKTVQTLALLLHRAADGPALVVAPASVLTNWRREIERFAPTLRVRLYWGPGRSLAKLAPGEVVLTTYGTLQRDADVLAEVSFRTAVLDEAQAIKNPAARRSKAAVGLDAAFRLGLSGTPVENRTEELWSLFRFVAPGLLGSRTRFQSVFVNRIEAQDDHGARASLAALVGPFLLRRTKGQVAKDLPDRIEMVNEVQLSSAERALYERTRLECVLRLEQKGAGGLQAAVELLKLRKLACNPRLYDAGSPVQSAKLHAVRRTVQDLRDSGHRMLIFSQFTSHLALVREALEEDGCSQCYLDGSLSLKRRQAEVDRFQLGETDVFLISLKAGGTGLNLTAATYVLHLDPWWNPAAEDQATDRAHRIGQHRAVTVVRFVAMGTVEEQILAMHADKRELAEALLAGRSGGAKMSPDVVLTLLQKPMDQIDIAPDALKAPAIPADPVPVAPDELDPLIEQFGRWMKAQGRRSATIRTYGNAVRHFGEWLEGPVDLTAVTQRGPTFVALAKNGEAGSKSDKVYARPALKSLEGFFANPHNKTRARAEADTGHKGHSR